jgi:hypothetical protein
LAGINGQYRLTIHPAAITEAGILVSELLDDDRFDPNSVSIGTDIYTVECVGVAVDIDVQPGKLNLSSNGVVPVAV